VLVLLEVVFNTAKFVFENSAFLHIVVVLLLPCAGDWHCSNQFHIPVTYWTFCNCCITKFSSEHCQYFNYWSQAEFSKAIIGAKYQFLQFLMNEQTKNSTL